MLAPIIKELVQAEMEAMQKATTDRVLQSVAESLNRHLIDC